MYQNIIMVLPWTISPLISILGEDHIDAVCKDNIGVVFDGNNYPDMLTPRQLGNVFENIYNTWDKKIYMEMLEKFKLPMNKKIKEFSKGMKMQYSICVAFSHHSRLLILDEATSGLDPIIRDDILDMFLDFIQDEENSILVSSHITSDLEKVADYIVFIHQGKIVFSKPKDEIVAYRKQDYEWQILVENRHLAQKKYPDAVIVPATIDEIMLMYIKWESK